MMFTAKMFTISSIRIHFWSFALRDQTRKPRGLLSSKICNTISRRSWMELGVVTRLESFTITLAPKWLIKAFKATLKKPWGLLRSKFSQFHSLFWIVSMKRSGSLCRSTLQAGLSFLTLRLKVRHLFMTSWKSLEIYWTQLIWTKVIKLRLNLTLKMV